jgi:hypothetical protein
MADARLLRAIKNRITELTLSLIPRPVDSREISLTIRDLERLLKLLSPGAPPLRARSKHLAHPLDDVD